MPRGHRRGHAVLLEEQPHRAQRALVLPRAHRRADPRAPDARHLAQRALGVAVDGGQHLLGAVALEQPRRPARPDVLDRAQVGEQRLLAGGLLDPGALGHEPPAVARVALPAALHGDRLALVDVVQRADEHDLLALVADPGQHREGAVGRPPAHGGHLDAERGLFGVERLHQAKVAPGRRERSRYLRTITYDLRTVSRTSQRRASRTGR